MFDHLPFEEHPNPARYPPLRLDSVCYIAGQMRAIDVMSLTAQAMSQCSDGRCDVDGGSDDGRARPVVFLSAFRSPGRLAALRTLMLDLQEGLYMPLSPF